MFLLKITFISRTFKYKHNIKTQFMQICVFEMQFWRETFIVLQHFALFFFCCYVATSVDIFAALISFFQERKKLECFTFIPYRIDLIAISQINSLPPWCSLWLWRFLHFSRIKLNDQQHLRRPRVSADMSESEPHLITVCLTLSILVSGNLSHPGWRHTALSRYKLLGQ